MKRFWVLSDKLDVLLFRMAPGVCNKLDALNLRKWPLLLAFVCVVGEARILFYGGLACWNVPPSDVSHFAIREEGQRFERLRKVIASGSHATNMCPDVASMPGYLHSEKEQASLYRSAPWHPSCDVNFGPKDSFSGAYKLDFPHEIESNTKAAVWCGAIRKNGAAFTIAGDGCQYDISNKEGGQGEYWLYGFKELPNVVNTDLSLSLNENGQLIGTVWLSTTPQSWGPYLTTEYLRWLRLFLSTVLLLQLTLFALLFSTIWRISVVSKKRDPNSPIPWIIEVPVRSAAPDHETEVNELFFLYESDYAERGFGKWLFLYQALLMMPFFLRRRVIYLAHRSLGLIRKQGGNALGHLKRKRS